MVHFVRPFQPYVQSYAHDREDFDRLVTELKAYSPFFLLIWQINTNLS